MFEVQRDKGEVGGDGDGGLVEHEALPLLRGRKVYLEDVERGKRVAVGEGVEARAEDNILRGAASNGVGQLIFSEAAARSHKAAEVLSDGVAGSLEIAGVAGVDERQRDGVVEDAGLLHELVSCTADGDAQCGSAGLAVFHTLECKGLRGAAHDNYGFAALELFRRYHTAGIVASHPRAFSIHMLTFRVRQRWHFLEENATLLCGFCIDLDRKCCSRKIKDASRVGHPGIRLGYRRRAWCG